MKKEILKELKNKDKANIFNTERYETVKQLMAHAIREDPWLKNYLQLDPYNKVDWIVDHLILLNTKGLI